MARSDPFHLRRRTAKPLAPRLAHLGASSSISGTELRHGTGRVLGQSFRPVIQTARLGLWSASRAQRGAVHEKKDGVHPWTGLGSQKASDHVKTTETKNLPMSGGFGWRFRVPIIHSLRDRTPPLCDSWLDPQFARVLTVATRVLDLQHDQHVAV